MIIAVKLYTINGVIQVDRDMTVYSEFHLDKLAKWMWHLQVYLNDECVTGIPEHPDYVIKMYEVDNVSYSFQEAKNTKQRHSPETIMGVVETYYKKYVCPALDVEDYDFQKEELVEMRRVGMAILKVLTDLSVGAVARLYNKHYTVVSYSIRKLQNKLTSDPPFKSILQEIGLQLNEPNIVQKILDFEIIRK